jgi:thioredoxin 1
MKLTTEVNLANFDKEVLNANQAVLVEFWTEACSACETMAPMLEEIALKYSGRVKIVRINVDENPMLAERHHVQNTPSYIFFSKGLVRDQIVGMVSEHVIVSKLDQFLEFKLFKNAPTNKSASH